MNVLIAGGTGFIGSYISNRFIEMGYRVNIISRKSEQVNWNESSLIKALEKTDILINLAGKSINCKHSTANKKLILSSRIDTTNKLGQAIEKCKKAPSIWINASASAIYKPSIETCYTETNYKKGDSFLAKTVEQWEKSFFDFKLSNTRQIAFRTSVVLGNNGGAFEPLKRITMFGLGGKVGTGKQIFSWIHIEDFFRIMEYSIQNESIKGAINVTSPTPLPNAEFMMQMRKAVGCKIGIPAPAFAIKIASIFLNTEPELLLDSVNYYPETLLENGFKFKFYNSQDAIKDLINN
ncbi:MAG: TIGR01777 family oxidoreductase [Paludibacter sp.]